MIQNLLLVKPFIKPTLIVFTVLFALGFTYYEGYTQGNKRANKDKEIAQLQLKISENNKQLSVLENKLKEKQKELELEKSNVKIVTEYKTKQVIVEKEKPVYEKRIEKVFVDKPVEFVDPELVRLHNDFVCNNQTSSSKSECGTSRESEKPITTEQFVKTVMDNYSIAIENQNKLEALQNQVINHQKVTEDSNGNDR